MPELTYEKLSDEAVRSAVDSLPGWEVKDGAVTKEFTFGSYAEGVLFAVACAHAAERLNHHPDLFLGYRKVKVAFVTHDAGGLTGYDIEAARRVEALA